MFAIPSSWKLFFILPTLLIDSSPKTSWVLPWKRPDLKDVSFFMYLLLSLKVGIFFFPQFNRMLEIMSRSPWLCLSLPNWTKWDQISFVGEDVQQITTTRNRLQKPVHNRHISCLDPLIYPHETGNCTTVHNAIDCNMLSPHLPSSSCDPQQNLVLQQMSIYVAFQKKRTNNPFSYWNTM